MAVKMYQGHIVIEDENDEYYYKIIKISRDFIGELPLEVSQHILAYLSPDELARCCGISRSWRTAANVDFLWRRHCLRVGISPNETHKPPNNPFDLCLWASCWNDFAFPQHNWRRNKYKSLHFDKPRKKYECFACHENRFVAYSASYNNLDVCIVTKSNRNPNNKTPRILLETCMALCTPSAKDAYGKSCLSMNDNYIIFSRCNIVLIFKKTESVDYDLFKAIKVGPILEFAERNIKDFVLHNWSTRGLNDVYGIIENYVWLHSYGEGDDIFSIDITTNISRIIFSYEVRDLTKHWYVTWSNTEDSLRIYDKKGNLLLFLDNTGLIEDVVVNNSLVCVQSGTDLEDEVSIGLWEMSTEHMIFSEVMPLCTWSRLHPSKEILFTLEASVKHGFYKITCWDIKPHTILWVYENTAILREFDFTEVISSWELEEVCGKYLIVWPLLSGQEKFGVLDARTGRLLYENTRPYKCVNMNYISDFMWFAEPRPRIPEIIIRCYL